MKKLISTILLASALVGTALGVSVSAAESGTNYGKVPMTDAKITIDGKKDAIYDKGLSIKIDKPLARTTKTATATGTMKLLWNGKDTIYMYTEIKDDEPIIYDGTPNAWETDSLEVFLDYSNKGARTRDQYRVDIKGAPTYHDGSTTYSGDDCKKYGLENWAVTMIDGGYAIEIQLKAYNESVKADMDIGFALMINDMHKSGPQTNMIANDTDINDTAKFGFITLTGTKVSVDAAKPAGAAQTADLSVVVPMLAMMSSGALIVLKKRK